MITATNMSKRATLLRTLRDALDQRGFIEVTTPVVLKVVPGKPKPSHPFEFKDDGYDLRTSIELLLRTALKFEQRVYDIGPAIRLKDKSKGSESAAEFTLMECFAADLDYCGLLNLAKELIVALKPSVSAPIYISVVDWFTSQWEIEFGNSDNERIRSSLLKILNESETQQPLWKLIDKVIEKYLEPTLKDFVFLTRYPIETICLANRDPVDSHVAQRFEMYLNGIEIGHGFVDSSDPDDILNRMKENGEEFIDTEFVNQLRSGSLPSVSAGFGLGIERLLACDDAHKNVQYYLHEYQHA